MIKRRSVNYTLAFAGYNLMYISLCLNAPLADWHRIAR